MRSGLPKFLRQLHDVAFGGEPSDGDALVYDAATRKWKPGAGAGGGGSMPVQVVRVAISAAEILACHTSPVELAPAPGSGKALVALAASARGNAGTPYSHSGGVGVVTPAANNPSLWVDMAVIIENAERCMAAATASAFGAFLDDFENLPLVFTEIVGDPTDGDFPIVIGLAYTIVDLT